jgi:ATP-dependent DNA ligase
VPLAVVPPIEPMLAKLARELPVGGYAYEPKWDGFRSLAFREGEAVELQSRKLSPFGRYFPELLQALGRVTTSDRFVLDGEIVVTRDGAPDFDALLKRIHPAARHVERMAREAPAAFVAFDLLAEGDEDLMALPFADRRRRLERVLAGAEPPLLLTPSTDDPAAAERWLRRAEPGIDGVVAKPSDATYQPGKRAMVKVKLLRTADCVVAGCRLLEGGRGISTLLLGLYGDDDVLHHVGVVGSFTAARRRELVEEVRPHVVDLAEHPWRHGFALEGGSMGRLPGSAARWTPDLPLDWVPLRPDLVCEAAYDQVDGRRWRHPGRFVRWRPDRDPRSCRIEQLDEP